MQTRTVPQQNSISEKDVIQTMNLVLLWRYCLELLRPHDVLGEAYLTMAWRANRSQAPMLKMPVLSMARLRTKAKRLTVRLPLMGTVLTKVVKLRPFPRVKEMTLVLGSRAWAVTCTIGTYERGIRHVSEKWDHCLTCCRMIQWMK